MNIGHVQGGTNAGWRRVRQAHKPWVCPCDETQPAHRNQCGCNKNPRPN